MATRTWRVVAELAAAQHGVITRTQAANHGVDHRQIAALIRRGLLDEPIPRVLRIAGSRDSWRQRVMIACSAFGAVASHCTAALLHDLDHGARGSPTRIDVTVRQGRQRHDADVVVHRAHYLDREDTTIVDGIPATSIARTLCDLGAVVGDDSVEQALDDALRRGVSLKWIASTLDRVERPGPSGTSALRRVLQLPDRSGLVPDSWRERVTERMLAHPEIGRVERQFPILDPGGLLIARVDLAVVDAKVGVEFHSDEFHFGPRRGRGDRRRDLAVSRVGWDLLYLDSTDHDHPADATQAVLDVVRVRRRAA